MGGILRAIELPGWTPQRRRAVRDGLVLAGLLLCGWQLWTATLGFSDAEAYRSVPLDRLYVDYDLEAGVGYAYSPAFALAIAPLVALPAALFRLVWLGLALAALAWLARPVPSFWRLPFLLLCLPEAINGNIHLLLAAAIALGARLPGAWAVVLLTKVTPGVGLAWHVARREWRLVVVALGVTAAAAGASWLVAPELWHRWIEALRANVGTNGVTNLPQVPLLIRLPLAAVVAWWAGRRGWRPGIAVAAFLALPHIVLTGATLLAAIPRLRASGEASGYAPLRKATAVESA